MAKKNKAANHLAKLDIIDQSPTDKPASKPKPRHAAKPGDKGGFRGFGRADGDDENKADKTMVAPAPAEEASETDVAAEAPVVGTSTATEATGDTGAASSEGGTEAPAGSVDQDGAASQSATDQAGPASSGTGPLEAAATATSLASGLSQLIPDPQAEAATGQDATSPALGAVVPGQEPATDQVPLVDQVPTIVQEPIVAATPLADANPLEPIEQKGGKGKVGRRVAIVLACILGVLVLAYGAGVFVFSTRFLPNTTINGEDASLASVADFGAAHTRSTDGYVLKVAGQGLSFTVDAAAANIHVDGEGFAQAAHDRTSPFAWPLEVFSSHVIDEEEVMTFDDQAVAALVTDQVNHFNETATKPENATFKLNDETHLLEIVPEVLGTSINLDVLKERVTESIRDLDRELEIGEYCLLRPERVADDESFQAAIDRANDALGSTQKLTITGKDVYTVDAASISKFVTVNDALEVQVNEEAARDWAMGELSEQLDTVGAEHKYKRPDGKEVTVSGGTYGWNINGEELARAICENVRNSKEETIEVPMYDTAQTYEPGGKEWGNRYVDIDLSEQYVRMYGDDSAVIWEAPCVSGNVNTGHGTPEGVFYITLKESGSVRLEGETDPITGQPEYVSYVTYWMPFVDNAVALHDATWRYSFGGDIYLGDGSHGCVNLPYDSAEALYGIINEGDVVVVHW